MATAADLMRSDYVAVEEGDPISDVLRLMQRGKTEAVITKGGKYVGMFDKRALLKSHVDPGEMKVRRSLIANVPRLSRATGTKEIVRLLYASDMHVLPVVDKNEHVEGVVGARHLLVSMLDDFKGMKVSDLASRKVTVLQETDELGKLVNVLRESRIGRVPIVDVTGRLSGVASVVDLLSKFLLMSERSSKGGSTGRGALGGRREHVDRNTLPVSNVMTRAVHTVPSSAALSTVIDVMHRNHVSDVIIVEKDVPVGIVTTKDLLGLVLKG